MTVGFDCDNSENYYFSYFLNKPVFNDVGDSKMG